MSKYILPFLFASLLFACNQDPSTKPFIVPPAPSLDLDNARIYLQTLSSDAFEGRMPCTTGEEKTTAFIADELKKIGLKPGNGDSYFQEVGLVDITGFPAKEMTIRTPAKEMNLTLSKDFMIHSERLQEEVSVEDSELVFCGYGIVDKERGWNDYEGIDMKGKTAVILINDPGYGGDDSTFFKGDTMTYFGRWTYKYDEADRQGADGLIIIHETNMAGYPWFVVESSWSGTQQGLTGIDRSKDCGIKGFITLDQAKALFENTGHNLTDMFKAARKPGFKPVPLNSTINMSLRSEVKECKSNNVVAYIEGEEAPEEYIIYTAHWDHLGVGKVVENDSIYNGALDNASGTATVLGIAMAFAEAKDKPKRSVVFLFVTAEEQGLLGSEYYAEKPLFKPANTICNLNMDGVNPMGKMKDLTIVGMGHSTMDDIAAEEAKKQGRYIAKEQNAEKGYFFRSDHFNFAKIGIPCLYAEGTYEHAEKGIEYAKEFAETYVNQRYHAPSDEYDAEEWNMGGMEQDGQFYLNVGWRIANSGEVPVWKMGSSFKR